MDIFSLAVWGPVGLLSAYGAYWCHQRNDKVGMWCCLFFVVGAGLSLAGMLPERTI